LSFNPIEEWCFSPLKLSKILSTHMSVHIICVNV